MAIRLAINCLIKAGANYTLTGRTTDQTILAETLPAGATSTNFGAILFAAETAHGAFVANVSRLARGYFDLIDAQMAATLTHATMAACLLASMANFVATDGAEATMVGAGAFPTGPTEATTSVTVGFVANGTERNSASGAEQILTTAALAKAVVTDEMAVAIQHHLRHFVMANVTTGPLQSAVVAIAQHLYGYFPLAVAQGKIGDSHRHLQYGVAKKLHLHPQPMILHFFGQLAFQVNFQGAPLFAGGIVGVVDLFDLLLVIGAETVERLVEPGQNLGLMADTAHIGVIDGIFARNLG
jgi:hypothetical protein